jgi:hypothetical protein
VAQGVGPKFNPHSSQKKKKKKKYYLIVHNPKDIFKNFITSLEK